MTAARSPPGASETGSDGTTPRKGPLVQADRSSGGRATAAAGEIPIPTGTQQRMRCSQTPCGLLIGHGRGSTSQASCEHPAPGEGQPQQDGCTRATGQPGWPRTVPTGMRSSVQRPHGVDLQLPGPERRANHQQQPGPASLQQFNQGTRQPRSLPSPDQTAPALHRRHSTSTGRRHRDCGHAGDARRKPGSKPVDPRPGSGDPAPTLTPFPSHRIAS